MNRLTIKQRGSISAFQGGTGKSRRSSDARLAPPAANESFVPNTRKAFSTDRTLNGLRSPDQIPVAKRTLAGPRTRVTEQGMLMHLTVDSCDVTDLRRRVIAVCGNLMLFMRIQPLQHASKMRVWILLQRQDYDLVTRAIKSGMPDAEIAEAE